LDGEGLSNLDICIKERNCQEDWVLKTFNILELKILKKNIVMMMESKIIKRFGPHSLMN